MANKIASAKNYTTILDEDVRSVAGKLSDLPVVALHAADKPFEGLSGISLARS